jgi:hypothetical protein
VNDVVNVAFKYVNLMWIPYVFFLEMQGMALPASLPGRLGRPG